jgi:hypothetical protein
MLSHGFNASLLLLLCLTPCTDGETAIEPCSIEGSDDECSTKDVTSLLTTSHVVKYRSDPQKPQKDGVRVSHHEARQMARGEAGLMLLGSMAFIMGIFYLVNSPMGPVRQNTWSMIKCSVSIICAVMLRDLLSLGINSALGVQHEVGDPYSERPSFKSLSTAATEVIAYWLCVLAMLYHQRGRKLRLKGYGMIGGHIMSFATISFYGLLLRMPTFRSSCYSVLAVIGIYIVGQSMLLLMWECIQKRLIASGYLTEEEDAALDAQVHETEALFFCIGLGFLLCYLTRFWIDDYPAELNMVMGRHSLGQIQMLGMIGVGKMFFSGSFNMLSHKSFHCATTQRLMDGFAISVAASSAFDLLWCANWTFYNTLSTTLREHLVVSLLMTVAAGQFILFISFMIHYGAEASKVESAFTAMSLLVGLSWQETFESSLRGLAVYGKSDSTVATAMFLVIVLPAWIMYIFPRGNEELEVLAEYERLNNRDQTLCCCGDPFKQEEDSDSDSDDDDEETKKAKMQATIDKIHVNSQQEEDDAD